MTASETSADVAWHSLDAATVAGRLGVDPALGLSAEEAARRLSEFGGNELPSDPPPSRAAIAAEQARNPMNIMLLIVGVASLLIQQFGAGIVVLLLVLFNVVTATNQELKARASVEALAQLQVPRARVLRGGHADEVDAADLVPGDVVRLEAGDVVPADARILSSATLELQEASLTGESAPVSKDSLAIGVGDVALGDRTNLVFQNTDVTRGTATVVVVATGQKTEMGKIAQMVTATKRSRSPLQRELDGMTKRSSASCVAFPATRWSSSASRRRSRRSPRDCRPSSRRCSRPVRVASPRRRPWSSRSPTSRRLAARRSSTATRRAPSR